MREVIPIPVPSLDLRREYGHHQSPAIWAGGSFFCSGMVGSTRGTASASTVPWGARHGASSRSDTAAGVDGVLPRPSGAGARHGRGQRRCRIHLDCEEPSCGAPRVHGRTGAERTSRVERTTKPALTVGTGDDSSSAPSPRTHLALVGAASESGRDCRLSDGRR